MSVTAWRQLTTVPLTVAEANLYVSAVHRHNGPLPTARIVVGVVDDSGLVRGVAVAGIPKARMLMDRRTLEVSRVATDGAPNACTMLYGAVYRAAKALGYRRLITYTLDAEDGASLKAGGWTSFGAAGGGRWSERRGKGGTAEDLGPKVRWEIAIPGPAPDVEWPDGVLPVPDPTLFA